MKLEVGKYYKTRDGRKVGPLLPAPLEEFPFKASRSGPWFTAMGEAEGDNSNEKWPDWDLISEWEESDTSCTKAGNTTVDLTAITTPFGLLDKATQKALKCHGGPYEYWDGRIWGDCPRPSWHGTTTYRVKPQPKRETVMLHGYVQIPCNGARFDDWGQSDEHTHRITFDLIDGRPDCASIRMEVLE